MGQALFFYVRRKNVTGGLGRLSGGGWCEVPIIPVSREPRCSVISESGLLLPMNAQPIALGVIVCQRSFDLYSPDGQSRSVTVRLGLPVATNLDGRVLKEGEEPFSTFRCPFQITGLDHDERVDGIFGEDPFVALQYALDFIGDRLNLYSKEPGLLNKWRRPDGTRDSWIWAYPPDR